MAQDSLEHAHGHGSPGQAGHAATPLSTRLAAVLVAVIAAVAVVVEMSGNDQQTAYLAHDVAASDLWSQYQGKSVRHTVLLETAQVLDVQAMLLPVPQPPAQAASQAGQPPGQAGDAAGRIAGAASAARASALRLEDDPAHDGMRQLSARAQAEENARDHALHLHEGLERSVRGLQIAIVLIGLFMATRLFWLLGIGGTLAAIAFGYGIATGLGLT